MIILKTCLCKYCYVIVAVIVSLLFHSYSNIVKIVVYT